MALPTVDHTTTAQSGSGASSLTFSFTVNSAANRLLQVNVHWNGLVTVSSITFNGVDLLQIRKAFKRNAVNEVSVDSWRLVAPDVTTANIVITMSGAASAVIVGAAFQITGASQSSPIGNVATALEWGPGTAADINVVTTEPDSLVMAAVTSGNGVTFTAGANQTEHYDIDAAGNPAATASTEPAASAGTIAMTHTVSASRRGVINGFAILAPTGLLAKAGNLQTGSATGSLFIDDIGFRGKVVLFFWGLRSETGLGGEGSGGEGGFGVGISSTARRSIVFHSRRGTDPSDDYQLSQDTRVYHTVVSTGVTENEGDFTQWTDDGFEINRTASSGGSSFISFLVLGGDALTDVALDTFTMPGSTGTFDRTGVGFQGDFLILFSTNATALDTLTDGAAFNYGFAKSSSEAALISLLAEDGISGGFDTRRYVRRSNGEVWARLSDADDNVVQRLSFDSWLSNGYRLNAVETTATATQIFALVLKGPGFHIGDYLTQTATGTFDYTGDSAQRKALVTMTLFTAGESTADTPSADYEWSMGAATSSSARGSVWTISNVSSTDNALHWSDFAKVYIDYSFTTGINPPTEEGAIDFSAWLSNGFRLNQTNADASQRFAVFFTVGDAVPVSLPPVSRSMRHILVR